MTQIYVFKTQILLGNKGSIIHSMLLWLEYSRNAIPAVPLQKELLFSGDGKLRYLDTLQSLIWFDVTSGKMGWKVDYMQCQQYKSNFSGKDVHSWWLQCYYYAQTDGFRLFYIIYIQFHRGIRELGFNAEL